MYKQKYKIGYLSVHANKWLDLAAKIRRNYVIFTAETYQ